MSIRVLRFMIGLIALVKFSDVYAVEYGLEADNLLKLEISDSGPTRINLKDEKINDILMCPQNVAEVIVHESGFLFIAPREEENKLYLSCRLIIITACVFSFEPVLTDTLKGQLNKIDGLFSGKLKTIGISSATILSSI